MIEINFCFAVVVSPVKTVSGVTLMSHISVCYGVPTNERIIGAMHLNDTTQATAARRKQPTVPLQWQTNFKSDNTIYASGDSAVDRQFTRRALHFRKLDIHRHTNYRFKVCAAKGNTLGHIYG